MTNVKPRLILICFVLVLFTCSSFAQDDGLAWLKKIDAAERVEHSYSTISQTITTSTGKNRTLRATSWSAEGGDVSLMVYTEPARVKGDKILNRDGGDNIWYYMKRRDVTRHFTGSARRQKAMGSDFSYQDLSQGDMVEDYTAEVLGYEKFKGEDCVKLNCVPTESGPSYDHIIVTASVNDHVSRKIDYYDEKGLLKILYIKDIREIEGRITGMIMEMVNEREGSKTILQTESITYKKKPDSSMFTKSALTEKSGF